MRDNPREFTGDARAERLVRAARAARELSDAVWECLQEQVRDADPAPALRLAERLAEVSATIAVLLEPPTGPADGRAADADGRIVDAGGRAADAGGRIADAGGARTTPADDPPGPAAPGAVAAGEHSLASEPPAGSQGPSGGPVYERRTPPEPVAPPPTAVDARLVYDQGWTATVTPFAPRAAAQPSPSVGGEAAIEIHDTRRDEGPSAWVSSVGRMLARYGVNGLPFAVLLVEIVDVAQLERSETPHDLHGIVARVESALGRGMRATDELSRETLGRYWLLAPETNGTGARMLAERLARLVRGSATHRGVPMEVAIGIAVCPEDGIEAPALAARADLGVYSARATGRSISHTAPPAG